MKNLLTESEIKNIIINEINDIKIDQELDSYLMSAGVILTPDEKMEIEPDCEDEIPQNEYTKYIEQIRQNLSRMDKKGLATTLKQVVSIIKSKPKQNLPIQEQLAPIIIAGVSVPAVAVYAVAGIVAIIILTSLVRLIRRGVQALTSSSGGRTKVRRRTNPACKRKRRLIRKFGVDGLFR